MAVYILNSLALTIGMLLSLSIMLRKEATLEEMVKIFQMCH